MSKNITVYELKYRYQQRHPQGHFFDVATMKFFGDTMANYGVRRIHADWWELYRKKACVQEIDDFVTVRLTGSHYFHVDSMEETTCNPLDMSPEDIQKWNNEFVASGKEAFPKWRD